MRFLVISLDPRPKVKASPTTDPDNTISTTDRSDHASFHNQGYAAALIIERSWSTNPNYHTIQDSVDTPGYIDYDYATRITQSAVGWLATEALLVQNGQAAIPEPATMALLGIGLALAARRRRASA